MAYKIATQIEAYDIGQLLPSWYDSYRCVTHEMAIGMNCVDKGDYDSNRLVRLSNLEKQMVNIFFYIEDSGNDIRLYRDPKNIKLNTTVCVMYDYEFEDTDGETTSMYDQIHYFSGWDFEYYVSTPAHGGISYVSISEVSPSENGDQRYW